MRLHEEVEEAAKRLGLKVRWEHKTSSTVEQIVEAVEAGLEVGGELVGRTGEDERVQSTPDS